MRKLKEGKSSSVLVGFLSNRLLYIGILAAVVLAVLMFEVSRRAVCLVVCDQTYELVSGVKKTPEEVLEQVGISLNEYDQVEVKDGQIISKIEVKRAYPVEVQADGRIVTVYTIGETVATLLERQNITLGAYDAISPSLDQVPLKNGRIIISRGEVTYEEETVSVPYQDVKVESDDYYVGTTICSSAGEEGEAVIRYALVYRDGELVSREQVSRTVVTDAIDAYIIVGTHEPAQSSARLTVESIQTSTAKKETTTSKKNSSSSKTTTSSSSSQSTNTSSGKTGYGGQRGTISVSDNGNGTGTVTTVNGTTYSYVACYYMQATAFCHRQTALGVSPSWGTVAVDKSVIPLRTKMYICNKYYTWQYAESAVAQDVGVIGQRVDLWMNNNTMCYTFGRRPVWVYVIG